MYKVTLSYPVLFLSYNHNGTEVLTVTGEISRSLDIVELSAMGTVYNPAVSSKPVAHLIHTPANGNVHG